MKQSLILIAAALLFSSASLSQSFTSVGPYGGWINDLATDASGNIYAATYVGGVFKTTNSGNTWVQIYNDTLIFDPRAIALNSIGHIFIGTSVQGFFRSTNGGTSWQNLNNALNTRNVRALLVPTNGDILAGCFPGGIYRSTDNGTTFTTINIGLTNTDVISLATKASNGYLFSATYGGGMFRSTNTGASWSAINNGIPSPLQMDWVGVSPSGDIYASQGLFLYRSTNNGDSWTDLQAPAAAYPEVAFTSNAMYAATNTPNRVYKSTDGGTTWVQETGLPDISFLNVIASGTTIITGTAGLGTYRSNGTSSPSDTWTQVVNGMTNTHVVEIDEAPNGDLYAATLLAGVWRSTNDGMTWFSVSNGIPPSDQLLSLAVSPTTGTVFVSSVGLSGEGYRSTDQGATWTGVSSLYAATALGCNARGHVFAGSGSRIQRSTNNGDTWTSVIVPTVQKIAEIAFERDTVYVATGVGSGFGTSRGVYRSTNNGTTWAEFNTGLTNLNVTTISARDSSSTLQRAEENIAIRVLCGTWGSGTFSIPNEMLNEQGMANVWRPCDPSSGLVKDVFLAVIVHGLLYANLLNTNFDILGLYRKCVAVYASALLFESLVIRLFPTKATSPATTVYLIGSNGEGIYRATNITSVEQAPVIPQSFLLGQNYPNPFNPSTKIVYRVKSRESVSLKVFDVLGREVATLVDEIKNPGEHAVTFDGGNLSSGVYFYKLRAGDFVETKKLVLLR